MGLNIIRRRNGRVDVSEEDGVRYLHLGNDAVQSAMRLARPAQLELSYTRTMMACLLFRDDPRDFCMIGLGGGSMAKFIHRKLPAARVHVVELNREVIAVARSMFGLPPDDARLRVEEGDGALFVASAGACADILMIDGFDRLAQVQALATRRFYDRAVATLKPGGMLAVNLLQDDRGLEEYLARIEAACGGGTLCLEARGEPNLIVFGFRDAVAPLRWDTLKQRALRLERMTGMRFAGFLPGLRRLNASTQTTLRPSRAAAAASRGAR